MWKSYYNNGMSRLVLIVMILATLLISPTAVSESCHQYSTVQVVLGGCESATHVTFTAELSSVSGHFVPLTAVATLLGFYVLIGFHIQKANKPIKVILKPQTPPPR